MTIRFRVTPAMFYRAQRAVARQIPWMRWSGYFVVLAFPLFMVAMALAYGGTVGGALRSNATLIVGLPVFWLVGIPALMRWNAGRIVRSTPAYAGEVVYTFSESGLDAQSAVASSHLAWSAFTRAIETSDFFLFFQNKAMALFVPKAAISGQAEVEALAQLVARHVSDTATRVSAAGAPAT